MRLIIKKLLTIIGVIRYQLIRALYKARPIAIDALRVSKKTAKIVKSKVVTVSQRLWSALKTKKAGKLLLKVGAVLGIATRPVKTGYRTAHHHTAGKLHLHLSERWEWYKKWHESPTNSRVMATAAASYVVIVFIGLFGFYRATFAAPDIFETWDFSTATDYTYDDGLEISGTSIRLKAQNYEDDADTAALYHLDESAGSTATDSSSNSNDGNLLNSPSWASAQLNNGLVLDGISQFISVDDSASLSLSQKNTLEGWVKFDSAFSANSHETNQTVLDKGSYRLYFDKSSGKLTYELENNNATWGQTGGSASTSWSTKGRPRPYAMANHGNDVYVGLSGTEDGDAEIWKWNGSSWSEQTDLGSYVNVDSLYVNGDTLYAGLSTTGAAGTSRFCDLSGGCSSWSSPSGTYTSTVGTFRVFAWVQFSGSIWLGTSSGNNSYKCNTALSSCTSANSFGSGHDSVRTLATDDSTYTYWGLGDLGADADVYRCDATPACSQIGGDGTGWPGTSSLGVTGMTYFGGSLYIGLTASNATRSEVYIYNGSWTKIGGGGLNGSWSTQLATNSLVNDDTNVYAGLSNGTQWRWNGSAWTQMGGTGASGSWSLSTPIDSMVFNGGTGHLYTGIEDSGNGLVYSNSAPGSGSTATLIGGKYVNSSWGISGQSGIIAQAVYKGSLYAGFRSSSTSGAALVWKNTSGSSWSLVGGAGVNSSWGGDTGTTVGQFGVYDGNLCVSITESSSAFSIWCYNDTSWTKIGDTTTNFTGLSFPSAVGLAVLHDKIYLAVSSPGNFTNLSKVYAYDGASWSTDLSITDNNTSIVSVNTLGDTIYVGTGNTYAGVGVQGIAGVRHKTGSGGAWQGAVCPESTSSSGCPLFSYKNTVYSRDNAGYTFNKDTNSFSANAFTVNTNLNKHNSIEFNGYLYYGFSSSLYRFDGSNSTEITTTTAIGTSGSFVSVTNNLGKLHVGLTGNSVWTLGTNLLIQSTANSWGTGWHHVAATYDGLTAKIFVDGAEEATTDQALSLSNNNLPLFIGNSLGRENGDNRSSYFDGTLDEVRISDQARTSLNTTPFANDAQTVRLNDPVRLTGLWHWDTWANDTTLNGGTVTYRLSKDDGTTWLYWNGADWAVSASTSQANDAATVDANIAVFPNDFGGLVWQAILVGDGTQRVTLNEVSASGTSDIIEPSANASNITALKAAGGDALADNGWTNGGSPFFSWDAGTDAESGVLGYCLYLGTDDTADPISTKGLLGTGPVNAAGNCQFAISTNEIDLATAGYMGTALTSSSSPYYLRIKTIDNAGNVSTAVEQFSFRFDNTVPDNPAFVSAPSGFVANKAVTVTWPTAGGDAAADDHSGVIGLQYRINSGGTWYGDSHSGSGDITDLLTNDGSYTTQDPPDFDDLNEGTNTIYFRTWDEAGNVTTTFKTAAIKINTAGAPSEPQNLEVTPTTNTLNSFAFSWDAPDTYNGTDTNIVYCYTVNTLPAEGTCTWTQPGITSLSAGPYATQPGANTFYVVAKDESGGVNYDTYASVVFTANTVAPGIPLNIEITDVSVRATSNWRLATTWEEPADVGSGVSTYQIHRSINNISYSQVGTSSNPSFVDAGLSQQLYYYKVRACDSTNNCGAFSTVVSDTPTGKFTSSALLTSTPKVSNVTTHKATVNWTTDRASDSRIAFGTSSGKYAAAEIVISAQVTDHEIDLDNLSAGTTYYGVAKWTDEDGNTGTSSEFSFKTQSAPSLKEITTSKVTTNSTTITFTSQSTTKVVVQYGITDGLGSEITVNTSQAESSYTVNLNNLSDGTKYFYRLVSYDSENFAYEGSIFAFTTLPQPRITNLRFQPIEGEPTSTQKVTWDTNVSATSQVTYGEVGTEGTGIASPKLVTKHEVIISNLKDNSEYFLVAQSRDAAGNVAVSDRQVFKTALDTRPPEISEINIETSIRGNGADARGQVIVSWKTDEPATSQVAYAEGGSATELTNKTSEDSALATEHIVIISDLPTSRVYSVAPVSGDTAKNYEQADSQPAIIGRASDSVLTIILNTLKSVFGF